MKSKQTIMLITSLVLCLAIYPLSNMLVAVMLMLTASVAALMLLDGSAVKGLIPVAVSAALAVLFYKTLGITMAIPAVIATVASFAGLVMGISIKGKWGLQSVLLFSGCVYLAAIIGAIVAVNKIYDIDSINLFITMCKEISTEASQQMLDIMKMYDALPTEINVAEMNEYINSVYDYITIIVPSILIVLCGMFAYIAFGIARFTLKKFNAIIPMLPDRRNLKMSRGSGWIMLLVWVLSYMVTNQRLSYALINISVIITVLFFICGISLILFMVNRYIRHGALRWLIRVGVVLTIMTSTIIPEVIIMGAIVDCSWDFRRLCTSVRR